MNDNHFGYQGATNLISQVLPRYSIASPNVEPHYQISGAVGILLRLFGSIDPEPLIKFAKFSSDDKRAKKVRNAAAELKSTRYHGAILADETGFGKNKETLLSLLLYCVMAEPTKPNVLLVPGTLIDSWLKELLSWPFFKTILSYEEKSFQATTKINSSHGNIDMPIVICAEGWCATSQMYAILVGKGSKVPGQQIVQLQPPKKTSYASHSHAADLPGSSTDPPVRDFE